MSLNPRIIDWRGKRVWINGASSGISTELVPVLYTDLSAQGIDRYPVNPGFVEIPLTQRNDFKMPALISARQAAAEILKGLEQGRFEIHFPKRFTYWMKLLDCLIERLGFPLLNRAVGSCGSTIRWIGIKGSHLRWGLATGILARWQDHPVSRLPGYHRALPTTAVDRYNDPHVEKKIQGQDRMSFIWTIVA